MYMVNVACLRERSYTFSMEIQRRRSRFKSNPTGKGRHGERLGAPNQIKLAKALQNGPLPSIYLHKVLNSIYSAKDVITFLAQEGIIKIPDEAMMHYARFGRPAVYQLSPKGIEFLKRYDQFSGVKKHGNGQYRHSLMASVVGHFFEVAPRFVPGLTLIPTRQGLRDSDPIAPDWDAFGYEYQNNRIFFAGFEADRGTEPLRGLERETIETKVRNYADYFATLKRDNIYIPFITLSERRAHNILGVIKDLAGDEKDHFLVYSMPDFIHGPFPPLTGEMVTGTWLTTKSDTTIMELLTNEHRPKNSSEAERVA